MYRKGVSLLGLGASRKWAGGLEVWEAPEERGSGVGVWRRSRKTGCGFGKW